MLETLYSYMNLYTVIAALVILLGLGYVLKRWYMISPYRYGGVVLLIAFLLGLGIFAVTRFGISPYWVVTVYAGILIGYLAAMWYHISWTDLMGKFYRRPTTPKTT